MAEIPSNAAAFALDEILAITGGRLVGPLDDRALSTVGISTDTRALVPQNAFVALRGARFDGHEHLVAAAEAGASLALVETRCAPIPGLTQLEVASTLDALRALATLHLARWRVRGGRVLAVTGSAGKTTTKEAIGAILREIGLPARVTAGNLNNLVGAPMTVLSLRDADRFAVLELGTSLRGEIPKLAAMVRPDVAIVTLISAAHTEGIGTIEDVATEKLSLFARAEGTLVGNADDPRVRAALASEEGAIGYGHHPAAQVRIEDRTIEDDLSQRVLIAHGDAVLDVRSRLLGEAGALAVAAAIAGVEALTGVALDGPTVSAGLAHFDAGRRLRIVEVGAVTVLDDSYNANPASCRSSIAVAAELAARRGRRLVLVLGEMRELGEKASEEHRVLGEVAAGARPSAVIAVAGEARRIADAAAELGVSARFVESAAEAAHLAGSEVRAGDVVLVKGSRSIATDQVVDALIEIWGQPTGVGA